MDDIGHILVEASAEDSINDLSWWKDGLNGLGKATRDISEVKNPNNVKPELQYQWRGGPDFDFEDTAAGEVKRVPRKDETNPKEVIRFARDMMNRGNSWTKVAKALKHRFVKSDLVAAKNGLAKLAKLDGIIGRFVVDATGYDSCRDAVAAASHSPWKSYISFIAGCKCGDHIHSIEDDGKVSVVSGKKIASLDDVFVADEKPHVVERCASTRLRIADWAVEGLPDEVLTSRLLRLSEMGYLPKEKLDEINASEGSSLMKLREAFRFIDNELEKNENTKYNVDVNPEEYQMDVSDNEVILSSVKTADVDFDGVPPKGSEVEVVVEQAPEVFDDSIDMNQIPQEIDTSKENGVEIDIGVIPTGDTVSSYDIELDNIISKEPDESVSVKNDVDFDI